MMMDDNAPEWDQPLSLTVTPAGLIHTLFATASNVHTGWTSCVESNLMAADLIVTNDSDGNYVRLVEQEFVEDESPDVAWHDWTVELRVGEVLVTGHWQLLVTAPPIDWDWCTQEAEAAFEKATVLVGKRVRRVMAVEDDLASPAPKPPAPKPRHH